VTSDFKAKHKEIELFAMLIMMSQRLAAGKRKFEDGSTVHSSPDREDENSEQEGEGEEEEEAEDGK